MSRKKLTDEQLLAEAEALDAAYAGAEAFDRAHEHAESILRELARRAADKLAEFAGVSDEAAEIAERLRAALDEEACDESAELRKAALSRGQP